MTDAKLVGQIGVIETISALNCKGEFELCKNWN